MNKLRLLLIHRRFSVRADAFAGQILIYGISLLIMVLGIRKVAAMQLTEKDLFFGIMLVMILSFQGIIMGTILGNKADGCKSRQ
jgi:hypothetical protein